MPIIPSSSIAYSLFLLSRPVVSQANFSPTSLWNSSVALSLQDRLNTAYSALGEGASQVDITSRPDLSAIPTPDFDSIRAYSQFYAALANFELSGQQNGSFNALATSYFQKTNNLCDIRQWELNSVDTRNATIRDPIDHGYAAIRWYKASRSDLFYQVARNCWDLANQFTMSSGTVRSDGYMVTKDFKIPKDCVGESKAATFLYGNRSEGFLSYHETALFSLLSALLADSEPSNTTYTQAATQTLDLVLDSIKDIFADKHDGMLGYYVVPCGEGPISISWRSKGTSTVGFLIETMSILHPHAVKKGLGGMLYQTISLALDVASNWFDILGVLPNKYASRDPNYEGEDGDMYFLRGIAEAYRLGPEVLPSDLRDSMRIILGVHYNIIRDHATLSSNVYGRSWTGPHDSSEPFNLYNQAAAAQVLVDGISIFRSNAESSISSGVAAPTPHVNDPSPTQSQSKPSPTHSQSKLSPGIITGVTVGGSVAFLLLLVIAILLIVRRRLYRGNQQLPSTGITPFVGSLSETQPPRLKDGSELPNPNPSSRDDGGNDRLEADIRAIVPNRRDPRPHENMREVEPAEMPLAFPDMVRAVYQRLWQPEGLESPPDYRSNNAGEAGRD
ncbi:hypothetical protein PM082_003194 [Marasmius tenuissimus]|nr:hypothetical protein PM082_003194 [Marasmius tenuissimus]